MLLDEDLAALYGVETRRLAGRLAGNEGYPAGSRIALILSAAKSTTPDLRRVLWTVFSSTTSGTLHDLLGERLALLLQPLVLG